MKGRMSVGLLIWRETQRAKLNTFLCFVTIVVAAGVVVTMVTISRASVNSTRIMMKQMGFNLLITPQGVDPARFQALQFQGADMPEEYVSRLAAKTSILAQHFVGKYQKTVHNVEGCTVVLTGVLAEVTRHGTVKKPMPTAYVVEPGKVFLGSVVAAAAGKKVGDEITILGRSFEVVRLLDEVGVIPEDIRVFAHLHDVQELLGVPGRINAIDALACFCPVEITDIVGALKKSIQEVLPEVSVQAYHSILLARHKQRAMVYRFELVALAIVMAGSAAAIWALTYQNVHNRRHEIGVLRALGVDDWRIGMLFVGKILGYGVAGAVVGCVLGYMAAGWLNFTGSPLAPPRDVWIAVVLFTPVTSALFGLPPILIRLLQEPIDVLGDGE